jgi:hypothetical protein
MKRDLDLIRQILLEVEKNDNYLKTIAIQAEGYSPEQVSYHVMLLAKAGLVSANLAKQPQSGGEAWYPKSLTWEGHEFLDATRNGTIWHQLKAKLKDQGIDAPLSVVQQLALKLVGQALGLGD